MGRDFDQVVNTETDTTIYSFNKIVQLLTNVNPNTIEMLGLEPWQYLKVSPIGQMLLDNKELFLSKKCINSFGGYANQQLYRLTQKTTHQMKQEELEKHILKTIKFMETSFLTRYTQFPEDALKLYIDKALQEDMETEIFMDVVLTHYPLRDYCSMWSELQNIVKSYRKLGKRNEKALEHGKIAKHMMHLIRLYYMCFDILEKGEIKTYRADEHDFLMEVRNGKYITEDNQVVPEFFGFLDELEAHLDYAIHHTTLPELPDYEKIDDLVVKVNEMIVYGAI